VKDSAVACHKKGTRNVFKFALKISPSGFELRVRFDHDGKNLIVSAGMFRNGRRVHGGNTEIVGDRLPFYTAFFLQHFAPVLARDLAQAEKLAGEMAKWIDQYWFVDLGKKKDSPENREALRFLKNWRRERLFAEAAGETLPDVEQIRLLRRLIDALDTADHKFLQALPKVARILSRRHLSGHARRDNWLLEYKLRRLLGCTKLRTPEEIQKWLRLPGSGKAFHDRLHALSIDHGNKPRGVAPPNYRFKKGWGEMQLNLLRE